MNYKEKTLLPAMLVFTAVLTWICIVVASGFGWNPSHVDWKFDEIAKVGDSFGVVSSAMASVAAFFAYATFKTQKEESVELKRRAAEPSFLALVERRYNILDRVLVTTQVPQFLGSPKEYKGADAFRYLVADFLQHRNTALSESVLKRKYETHILDTAFGIVAYHRYVYHIIDFAEHHFSSLPGNAPMNKSDQAYFYVKLLRAELSDEELVLMSLNALYGGGYPKLKYYIERYALLNNLNPNLEASLNLRKKFHANAFNI